MKLEYKECKHVDLKLDDIERFIDRGPFVEIRLKNGYCPYVFNKDKNTGKFKIRFKTYYFDRVISGFESIIEAYNYLKRLHEAANDITLDDYSHVTKIKASKAFKDYMLIKLKEKGFDLTLSNPNRAHNDKDFDHPDGCLYYLKISHPLAPPLYKIGVSLNPEKRFKQLKPLNADFNISVLKVWELQSSKKARKIEQKVKNEGKNFIFNSVDILNNGNTEIFTIDLLNLDSEPVNYYLSSGYINAKRILKTVFKMNEKDCQSYLKIIRKTVFKNEFYLPSINIENLINE